MIKPILVQEHCQQERFLHFLNSEGDIFETLKAQAVWSRITLNRGLFPTNGSSIDVLFQTTVPGSDIDYYKINLKK